MRRLLNDLEVALAPMAHLSILFNRLEENQKHVLPATIAKRIAINPQGESIACELNSPFACLLTLIYNLIEE